jgi:hypothetical protein
VLGGQALESGHQAVGVAFGDDGEGLTAELVDDVQELEHLSFAGLVELESRAHSTWGRIGHKHGPQPGGISDALEVRVLGFEVAVETLDPRLVGRRARADRSAGRWRTAP